MYMCIHNSHSHTQCRWQWSSKLYLYMHCKTNAYKSRFVCVFARYTMHTKWLNNQNNIVRTNQCLHIQFMHMVLFFLSMKKAKHCVRTDNPFSSSSHSHEFYMFLRKQSHRGKKIDKFIIGDRWFNAKIERDLIFRQQNDMAFH